MNVTYLSCCGVKELANIQFSIDPEDVLKHLYYTGFDKRARFFVFTQADARNRNGTTTKSTYGVKLSKYIEKYNLGNVTRIGSGSNPNSSNVLTMWVWKINSSAFTKHANKLGWRKPTQF